MQKHSELSSSYCYYVHIRICIKHYADCRMMMLQHDSTYLHLVQFVIYKIYKNVFITYLHDVEIKAQAALCSINTIIRKINSKSKHSFHRLAIYRGVLKTRKILFSERVRNSLGNVVNLRVDEGKKKKIHKSTGTSVMDPHWFQCGSGPVVYLNANPDPGSQANAKPWL